MKCCICEGSLRPQKLDPKYWGHNALPVKDGRCCETCNALVVIPERMRLK